MAALAETTGVPADHGGLWDVGGCGGARERDIVSRAQCDLRELRFA